VHAGVHDTADEVVAGPGFPSLDIRLPVTELPEFLRSDQTIDRSTGDLVMSAMNRCPGLSVTTFSDLEHGFREMYVRNGHARRGYFVGHRKFATEVLAIGERLVPEEAGLTRTPCWFRHRQWPSSWSPEGQGTRRETG
jgi:hypothetical protein